MLIKTSKTRFKIGRTRAEQAENLRRVYGGSGGMTDENLDKLKYAERKLGIKGFVPQAVIDDIVRDT